MNRNLTIFISLLIGLVVGGAVCFAVIKNKPELLEKPTAPTQSTEQKAPATEQKGDVYNDIYRREQDMMKRFDALLDGDFFGKDRPLESMKQFRKDMENHFGDVGNDSTLLTDPFDTWFTHRFGGGTLKDIQQREDAKFVYFDVKVNDLKSTSISTEVKDGYVSISGKIEKKSTDKSENESIFESSFRRILPLPPNVDATKMETLTQGNTVTLKFPKLTT